MGGQLSGTWIEISTSQVVAGQAHGIVTLLNHNECLNDKLFRSLCQEFPKPKTKLWTSLKFMIQCELRVKLNMIKSMTYKNMFMNVIL
jgi:hypothetical protein